MAITVAPPRNDVAATGNQTVLGRRQRASDTNVRGAKLRLQAMSYMVVRFESWDLMPEGCAPCARCSLGETRRMPCFSVRMQLESPKLNVIGPRCASELKDDGHAKPPFAREGAHADRGLGRTLWCETLRLLQFAAIFPAQWVSSYNSTVSHSRYDLELLSRYNFRIG
jgi:hypothetical protein